MKHEKIAPSLTIVLRDYKGQGLHGLKKHMSSLGIISSMENAAKPPRVVSFVYCDSDTKFDSLSKLNIIVNQKKGKIRTAFFPLDALEDISEDDKIKRIIPAHYLQMKMDVAPGKVNLPQFINNANLSGNGVIIGIVDSGIDPNHSSFNGRILKIWDQELSGPGVDEGHYGLELTGNTLTASRDTIGHGTHVAGMAGGVHPQFGGVAPESEFLIVKTDFQNAHIADGVRYIFRVASDLGKPAVVNLSLGGHFDAHDGTDPLSQIIDSEVGPGRIVCCAAGNEGTDNIHAQKLVTKNQSRSIRFMIPSPGPEWAALNGWYSGIDKIKISIKSPTGLSTPYQKVNTQGDPTRNYNLPDGNVTISTPPPDPSNGDHNFVVSVEPHGFTPLAVERTWKLLLRGESIDSGRVDIWILDSLDQQQSFFTGTSVNDSVKIGSPGSASKSITVASYTTKNKWIDIDGANRGVAFTLDTISDFSSEGPLRNEAHKPDISAPGAYICSALSADSELDRGFMISSSLRMMAGTSMATPFITGIVALLLQRDNNLDPNGVKSILRANGRIPEQPQNSFDTKWGHGLIDMSHV